MFTSGFFNSINSDRKYNAEQMAAIFDGLITDGIFDSIGDHFQVTPASSGLGVNIGTGRAWLNQTWSYNDTAYPLTLGAASSSLGRKDLICLKVDKSSAVRSNSLVVIAGTPAASPVEPTVADDTTNGIYYHKLAAVTVPKGATSISAANIQNYIGLSTGTPYVTGILSSTTVDELWSQWDGEFNDWWDDIKATLDDNIVTTILNKIDHITPKEATMNLYGFSHINPPPSGMEYKEYSTDAILNQISSLLNEIPAVESSGLALISPRTSSTSYVSFIDPLGNSNLVESHYTFEFQYNGEQKMITYWKTGSYAYPYIFTKSGSTYINPVRLDNTQRISSIPQVSIEGASVAYDPDSGLPDYIKIVNFMSISTSNGTYGSGQFAYVVNVETNKGLYINNSQNAMYNWAFVNGRLIQFMSSSSTIMTANIYKADTLTAEYTNVYITNTYRTKVNNNSSKIIKVVGNTVYYQQSSYEVDSNITYYIDNVYAIAIPSSGNTLVAETIKANEVTYNSNSGVYSGGYYKFNIFPVNNSLWYMEAYEQGTRYCVCLSFNMKTEISRSTYSGGSVLSPIAHDSSFYYFIVQSRSAIRRILIADLEYSVNISESKKSDDLPCVNTGVDIPGISIRARLGALRTDAPAILGVNIIDFANWKSYVYNSLEYVSGASNPIFSSSYFINSRLTSEDGSIDSPMLLCKYSRQYIISSVPISKDDIKVLCETDL